MGRNRRWRGIGVLAATITLLLPAAVIAATAVDRPQAGPDVRVDAASLAASALEEQQAEAARSTSTVAALTTAATSPTTVGIRPSTTTTTTKSRTIATTTTVRPGPTPGAIPTSTVVSVVRRPPPVSITGRWSSTNDGVSVRMRMEPASPVAGQPVTIYIDDLIAGDPCCFVKIMFGDRTEVDPVPEPTCDSPDSRTGIVATHTYAAPGAYRLQLFTATLPCPPPTTAGGGDPDLRRVRGAYIDACIAVGPGTPAPGSCPPMGGEVEN